MPAQIATMSQPLILFGYQIVFEALDPDSLAAVSGVEITNPTLSGVNLSGDDSGDAPTGPFMLVPGPNT